MAIYWQQRQTQLNKMLSMAEKATGNRLKSFYQREFAELDTKVKAYFAEYGESGVIEYRHMLERLTPAQAEAMYKDWQEFVEKYPEYAHLAPVRESIYRLDRLQGLQNDIIRKQYEGAIITEKQTREHLDKLARTAYRMANEAVGAGRTFSIVNSDVVKMFVDRPWCNGENFSQRIWQDTSKVAAKAITELAGGFARGDSMANMSRRLKDLTVDSNQSNAMRLVYTEGTYVTTQASKQAFVEAGFGRYTYHTMGDDKVCEDCAALEGESFSFAEAEPGVNFPPMHPWCRCTYLIELD